ncbi:Transposase IS4 family protein [Neochlamydia sp. TUME1]|uniref:hypothetical protein n=1 Tax=Neochlamydia sp. TUME1 TaxID=1478174 RepID=UPI00058278D9|nr:hypothetical protein [Neochlamydia sp. TUME1]KIC75768.1 Transposase IS4 family protein [Neochlamydia sp. TUME1]
MGIWAKEKKYLCAAGLLAITRKAFTRIKEPSVSSKKAKVPLVDCLMSGLALFGLKFPSLLKFDQRKEEPIIKHNLLTLYKIEKVPSDTYLRERLDVISPSLLRGAFCKLFAHLPRGKVLENFLFLNNYYLLSLDGTGVFSSETIHCKHCCEKKHRDGSSSYYHQILAGSIVHPDCQEVIPVGPEPISNEDGASKNDCESNAAKRFIQAFRKEHPHLNVIVTQDALSANGPHLKELQQAKLHYIIGVKPEGNASLFEWMQGLDFEELTIKEKKGELNIRFINGVPLNDTHADLQVNFFESWINDSKQGKKHFTWITDLPINANNVYELIQEAKSEMEN